MSEGWIDRYELLELLSRGGMGEVWRAYDEVLDRPVAIKLLYDELGETPDRDRFLREARAAARLSGPNLVATHDVGEWDGRPYLVMEYLTGRTLHQELEERGPLPIAEVRELGAQIAAALEGAHEAGIVHRDLKLANLMLTATGEVKLIDFGLAWLLDESAERLTPDDTAVGTITSVAPELATGQQADERSDLYSLGCVLYELACGRPPFQGSMAEIVLGHVQQEPDPPSTLRPDLPADLEALILHLLAKDPSHRPGDAGEVRRRLFGVAGLIKLGAVAIPQPRKEIEPSVSRSRSRRGARLLAGGLVAAVVLALVLWWALPGIGQGLPLADRFWPSNSSGPDAPPLVQQRVVTVSFESDGITAWPNLTATSSELLPGATGRMSPAAGLGLRAGQRGRKLGVAGDGKDVPGFGGQPPGQSRVRGDDPARKGKPVSLPADRGRPEERHAVHRSGRHHARR